MDHLQIPQSCRPQAMAVPYLGLAPSYDRKGFYGFPERHGIDVEVLLSRATISEDTSPAHAIVPSNYSESLLQEWL